MKVVSVRILLQVGKSSHVYLWPNSLLLITILYANLNRTIVISNNRFCYEKDVYSYNEYIAFNSTDLYALYDLSIYKLNNCCVLRFER